LGCLDVRPGTQLANIGNMPDVQPSRAPRDAFGAAFQDASNSARKLPRAVETVYFTEFVVQT